MNRFYTTLSLLAVILTPVAMMTAAGWHAYAATLADTGVRWLAILSGVATAIALELVGILAGELALWFHGRHDPRWRAAGLVLAVYVLAGVYLLWATPLIFLPILAGSVYILVGLRAQAIRETAAQATTATAAADWEREQWRIRQADKTALKLAEIEHRASTEPALAPQLLAHSPLSANGVHYVPALPLHECPGCDRAFPTVQALNAHQRFCSAAESGRE